MDLPLTNEEDDRPWNQGEVLKKEKGKRFIRGENTLKAVCQSRVCHLPLLQTSCELQVMSQRHWEGA